MQERVLDARGLDCPGPLLLAKKAMEENPSSPVRVIVDDNAPAENIKRLASNRGWTASVEAHPDPSGRIEVYLAPPSAPAGDEAPATEPSGADAHPSDGETPGPVVFIASDKMGEGPPELGSVLIRAFIKTLRETTPPPSRMIFINSGVRLSAEGSDLIDDLRALEDSGTEILSCGTCLDFFRLKDKLRVGRVSNMFEIASSLLQADHVVRP